MSHLGRIVPSRSQLSSTGTVSGSWHPSVHVPARWGNMLIVVFVVVFGGWGCFVPLDGGAVAPGVINPDSGKKTIQHLEGGIIADLPVREGQSR